MSTTLVNLSQLFAALPERYVVFAPLSPEFTILEANDEYLRVTGKLRAEIIGRRLFDAFPDVSEQALKTGKGELQHSLERVIQTMQPDSTGVIRYDLADEKGAMQVRYWQATHYPLIEDGVLTAIIQSTADVTERIHSSQELKLANLKLDDALRAGLIGSWSWDIASDTVIADKGLAELFGISNEQALNGLPLEAFMDAVYEEDRAGVTEALNYALAGDDTFEREFRAVDADGVISWVIARGRVYRDASGVPTQFPGVLIDISSRKHAETELRKSEERLRFMADAMPQLVWISRPDGYTEYFNAFWYEYTGTSEGESDGEAWNKLLYKRDQARARRLWHKAVATGEPYEIKYRLYNAESDRYRWVIGRGLPYRDETGKIVKWYGTCTDIDDSIRELEARKRLETALKNEKDRLEDRVAERTSQLKLTNQGLRDEIRKRQEVERQLRDFSAALEKSNTELSELNQTKDEFISIASHQLRTPATTVKQYIAMVLDGIAGEPSEQQRKFLQRAYTSNERQLTTVNDLLKVAQIDAGRMELALKVADISALVGDVVHDFETSFQRVNQKLTITSTPSIEVNIDENALRMVLDNLLENARKYSEAPATTKVDLQKTATSVVITVADQGVGIAAPEKLFQKFSRINNKLSHEVDGTGLGLYWARSIAQLHGGSLVYTPNKSGGSIFTLTLPLM